jgi:two-component system, sensor histidine kinase SagS
LADRPRVLVFTGSEASADAALAGLEAIWEIVRAPTLKDGLARLQAGEHFDGLFVPAQSPGAWQRTAALLQHEAILEELGDGVAIVHPDLRIAWANPSFEKWCGGAPEGTRCDEALGTPGLLAPLQAACAGRSTQVRLPVRDNRYVDLRLAPLTDPQGQVRQVVVLCREATTEVQRQQKLDALHQASREIAARNAEQLAAMSVEERVELLKHNIRRLTHDLLHYDVIEIRLLDPRTGELRPLLCDGMTPEATRRVLYAKTEGNGVSGYVAATGKTYLCNDTASDPHYLEGAKGARSSLTVALRYGDKVIGTFNVENGQPGSFGPEDVQFTEIFCSELANALVTLDLLLVEKQATASQSIDAINREVSIPVDEILAAATGLLERWVGHEEEVVGRLRKIIAASRTIKQSIQKVGEDLAPQVKPLALGQPETPHRLALRVLVADQDERVRRSAHSILGRLGCVVEKAREGKEAVTMAKLTPYDVILADIRLPDLGGYEAYRAFRQAQPGANVVLMTGFGYDATHSIVKARQDGLRYVLYKPFRVDQLLAALQADAPARTETKEGSAL